VPKDTHTSQRRNTYHSEYRGRTPLHALPRRSGAASVSPVRRNLSRRRRL